jgi:NADH-quinone oxidoreductase subunit N
LQYLTLAYAAAALIFSLVALAIVNVLNRNRRAAFVLSSAVLGAISILSIVLFVLNTSFNLFGLFNIYGFSPLLGSAFGAGLLLINILGYETSDDYTTFSLLLCMVSFGTFVVVFASSILEIFLGLEMVMLITSFIIIISKRKRIEAAAKLFLVAAIAAAFIALAISLLLPYNSTLALVPAQANSAVPYMMALPIILFVVALSFEGGLFPFNLWIPDVYSGADTTVTSLLSGVNKMIALVALIEILFMVFGAQSAVFSGLLELLAILTMFFGNIMALRQANVKRMFIYSAIAQVGYIAVGLASATWAGVTASIFYIVVDLFVVIGTFAAVSWMESHRCEKLDDYRGLYSRNAFAAVAMTLLMLSMAGIPPLAGFAGKFLLFSGAIGAKMLALAVLGVINSIISVYYYGRLINNIFTYTEKEKFKMGLGIAVIIAVAVIVVIAIGVYPQPLISAASSAAASLGI